MKRTYLLDMLPFSDGLLKDCNSQIVFDELVDLHNFIAHFAGYLEEYTLYESYGKSYRLTQYKEFYRSN